MRLDGGTSHADPSHLPERGICTGSRGTAGVLSVPHPEHGGGSTGRAGASCACGTRAGAHVRAAHHGATQRRRVLRGHSVCECRPAGSRTQLTSPHSIRVACCNHRREHVTTRQLPLQLGDPPRPGAASHLPGTLGSLGTEPGCHGGGVMGLPASCAEGQPRLRLRNTGMSSGGPAPALSWASLCPIDGIRPR